MSEEIKHRKVDIFGVEMKEALLKAFNLKSAEEVNAAVDKQTTLEDMLFDTVNTMSYATANILYEFNGMALTREDGTRYLGNKALHANAGDGKLFSGNPLDLQGAQVINCGEFTLSSQKATYLLSVNMHDITLKQYLMHMDLIPLIWVHDGYLKVSVNAAGVNILALEKNKDYVIAAIIDNNILKVVVNDNLQYEGSCNNIATNGTLYIGGSAEGNYADASFDYALLIDDAIIIDEVKRFRLEPERALIDYGTNAKYKGLFTTDFKGVEKFISNINDFTSTSMNTVENNIIARSYPGPTFTVENNIAKYSNPTADLKLGYIYLHELGGFKSFNENEYGVVSFLAKTKNNVARYSIGESFVRTVTKKIDSLGFIEYKAIFKVTDKKSYILFMAAHSSTELEVDISSIKLEKLTGLSHILGYNDLCRANKNKLETCVQHLVLNRKHGFTTNLSDALNFKDTNGFVSIPSLDINESFTLELCQFFDKNDKGIDWRLNGDGLNTIRIGKDKNQNTCYINIFGVHISSVAVDDAYMHMQLSYDAQTKTALYYQNGKLAATARNLKSRQLEGFFLGKTKTGGNYYTLQDEILIFNMSKGTRTAVQAKTIYDLRKKQYPTKRIGE